MKLRPEVQVFAEGMEQILQANTHKGDWKDSAKWYLLRRLKDEVEELEKALSLFSFSCKVINITEVKKLVKKEAFDVANFAMMIADNFGDLMEGITEKKDIKENYEAMCDSCFYQNRLAEAKALLRRAKDELWKLKGAPYKNPLIREIDVFLRQK